MPEPLAANALCERQKALGGVQSDEAEGVIHEMRKDVGEEHRGR